jgi:methyl-galactoside transport system substrate-binding protein
MKKKALALLLGICMITMTACGNASSQTSGEAPASTADEGAADDAAGAEDAQAQGEAAGSAVAGVVWYNFADTFISNARQTLINIGAADGTITITDADSTNDVSTQTSNMNNFFTQGVDYLVLNNINTGAITEICDQIQAEGCYGIFANTDTPSDEDFAKNDKLYSVSSVATQSGTIMGEALAEYWQAHPEADRNGNGKLDYVMLLGIQGHYDTTVRSQYSVQALEDAGIEVNNIGGEIICDYSRATAQEKVAALLANYSDDIDAVIACNDDMALGAIEALKAGGFFTGDDTYLPVCGVDATVNGCQAIKDGTMLVTALNNPVMLAKSIYKVMYLTNSGQEVTTESMGLEGVSVEGHRVWLDYSPVTIDNVDQATYDINDTAF